MGKTTETSSGGTWKRTLMEIGLTLTAVLGEEVSKRAFEWVKSKRPDKSEKKVEKESTKNQKKGGENGTRN